MARSEGCLYVVGIGPGQRELMTPLAREILAHCDEVVGYSGYLASLTDLVANKKCHSFPLGAEVERATLALELARGGKVTVVISSGDPGIYGMAGVVLEKMESISVGERPEVVLVPGVSAITAAASLLGAPLGHDFAVVSLSDLFTPWEHIEKRLHAAAEADFVLALLNPKSRQRDWQLVRAQQILLEFRTPQTPVGIVRNAYRPEQAVDITTLASLTNAAVDMFTTVIVGNSQTRSFQSTIFTPRGIPCGPKTS